MLSVKKTVIALAGVSLMFGLTGCNEAVIITGDGENPPSGENSYSLLSSTVEKTFLNAATDDFEEFCEHVTLESEEAAKRYSGSEAGTCATGWKQKLQNENILGTDEGWTVSASNFPDEKVLRGEESVTVYVYEDEEEAVEKAGTNTWVVFDNGYAGGTNLGFKYEDGEWKVSSTP